jgi:histone acetyltransferase (RNA polymerase elongator complex component)
VRIYPALVFESTELACLLKAGQYMPQTLEQAVSLCAALIEKFENANIQVVRAGLHGAGCNMAGFLAGPAHPAFKELCDTLLYRQKIENYIAGEKASGKALKYIEYAVPSCDISKAIGHKKSNLEHFGKQGITLKIKALQN